MTQPKTRFDLVPWAAITDIADILTFGAQKYADNNWCRGTEWSRYYSALCRHIFAWWQGEDLDPETGKSHLAHAGCCLVFLMEYQRNQWGTDDRFTGPDDQEFVKADGIRDQVVNEAEQFLNEYAKDFSALANTPFTEEQLVIPGLEEFLQDWNDGTFPEPGLSGEAVVSIPAPPGYPEQKEAAPEEAASSSLADPDALFQSAMAELLEQFFTDTARADFLLGTVVTASPGTVRVDQEGTPGQPQPESPAPGEQPAGPEQPG